MSCYRRTFQVPLGIGCLEIDADLQPKTRCNPGADSDEMKLQIKAVGAMCLRSVTVYPPQGIKMQLLSVELNGSPLLAGQRTKAGLRLEQGDEITQTFRFWDPGLN